MKVLIVDPDSGWRYGFPKIAPENLLCFSKNLTGVTIQKHAGLANGLLIGISRNRLKRLINKNNGSSVVHNHYPVQDGIDHRFPVFVKLSFEHNALGC